MPFSARCFHHLYARYAAGTATTTPAIGATRTPAATAPAVVAPAAIPFFRDSSSTSERVLLMARKPRHALSGLQRDRIPGPRDHFSRSLPRGCPRRHRWRPRSTRAGKMLSAARMRSPSSVLVAVTTLLSSTVLACSQPTAADAASSELSEAVAETPSYDGEGFAGARILRLSD